MTAVLTYETDHGLEVHVFHDAESAWRGAGDIMLDWIDDFVTHATVRAGILAALAAGDYQGAAQAWCEWHDPFERFQVDVMKPTDGPSAEDVKQRAQKQIEEDAK